MRVAAAALAVAAFGTALGGCSQLYLDRRDTIALSAGDAIAANQAVQTIDPWPPFSGRTNLTFNGQRMQAAAERFRTNTVTQPGDPMAAQLGSSTNSTSSSSSGSGGIPANSTPNTSIVVGSPAASQ